MGGQWEIKCLECGKLIPREGKICPFCRTDKAASIEEADRPIREMKESMAKGWATVKANIQAAQDRPKLKPGEQAMGCVFGLVTLAGTGAFIYWLFSH